MSVRNVHSVSRSVLKHQKLLRSNPVIICEIYFCKLQQALTLCGIYFLLSRDKFAKKKQKKNDKNQ